MSSRTTKFRTDLISSFCVILLTDKQADTGENIIAFSAITTDEHSEQQLLLRIYT